MARKKASAAEIDHRRQAVWKAADEIRAEGNEPVALRNVWARVKRNAGVAGSNQIVGEHLSAWAEEHAYSPIIELARMPDAISTLLAKAASELWKAAQGEAARVLEGERVRMAEAIAMERVLRIEALGMLDARDAVITGLRADVDRHASELEEMRKHLGLVRGREFWGRVAQEIWEILPERDPMHVNDVTKRIGHEFVKEAEDYPGVWGPGLLRGVIDQRIKFKKLFASEGGGRYRRRRPEDDAA